jgi:hypothetical protein
MPAGTFPAGIGPCGLDPLPDPLPARDVSPPVALRFDGATQDFPLDANGRYLSIHPVDQQVALALLIGLGTLPSVPTVGAAFRQITRITNATETQAANMARAALAKLVAAKEVQIVTIDVEVRLPQGSTSIAVTYLNLVTSKKKTFSLPQGTFTGA